MKRLVECTYCAGTGFSSKSNFAEDCDPCGGKGQVEIVYSVKGKEA